MSPKLSSTYPSEISQILSLYLPYDITNIMNICHTISLICLIIIFDNLPYDITQILPEGALGNGICTVVALEGPRLGKCLDMAGFTNHKFLDSIGTMIFSNEHLQIF